MPFVPMLILAIAFPLEFFSYSLQLNFFLRNFSFLWNASLLEFIDPLAKVVFDLSHCPTIITIELYETKFKASSDGSIFSDNITLKEQAEKIEILR